MKLIYRVLKPGFVVLIASCATTSPYNPWWKTVNDPWQTPNRHFYLSSGQTGEQLISQMETCFEHARETVSEALRSFKTGLPAGAGFNVIAFNDSGSNVYIEVESVDDRQIHGRVSGGNHVVKGVSYSTKSKISLNSSEIIDWQITYPDKPAEGNLFGKFLLLKQDGLAPGACDPSSIEYSRYRYFSANYSFVPTSTEGWSMRGSTGDSDMLMQIEGESPGEINSLSSSRYPTHSYAAASDLVNKIRESNKKNYLDTNRYSLKKLDVSEYPSKNTICAKSHLTVDDKQAQLSSSGERAIMVFETQSLSCVHPEHKDMIIEITHTHRYQPGNRNPAVVNSANDVFESLAFTVRNYR